MELISEVQPMEGARELMQELRRRGHKVLLASSAKPEELEHYLDLLDGRELADGWTSAGDVEATKPEPDLVNVTLEKADAPAEEAVMIGDSTWDVEAATRAAVATLGVITGGFCEDELRDAGAIDVFQSVGALCGELDRTPLR